MGYHNNKCGRDYALKTPDDGCVQSCLQGTLDGALTTLDGLPAGPPYEDYKGTDGRLLNDW